jgi:RNA polymerase sigma-70 factor (ECF subfamily)
MSQNDMIPGLLMEQTRTGDAAARGRLLERYRNYLRLMARTLISQPLRVRLDASDLVQETLLKAHREFTSFLGSTEPELVAWLRQILVRSLSDQVKLVFDSTNSDVLLA